VSRRTNRGLAELSSVGSSLLANPARQVLFPIVTLFPDRSPGGTKKLPLTVVPQRRFDRLTDEATPSSWACHLIDASDKILGQVNV
jgi:hypothetical protein